MGNNALFLIIFIKYFVLCCALITFFKKNIVFNAHIVMLFHYFIIGLRLIFSFPVNNLYFVIFFCVLFFKSFGLHESLCNMKLLIHKHSRKPYIGFKTVFVIECFQFIMLWGLLKYRCVELLKLE